MIEEGRHKARAVEWKLGMTKNGGEQIGVLFQLEDGQTISWYGYFTEKTAERTLESLEYMGWDGIDIVNPKGLDSNEVQLVVEHEKSETDGKTYARVRWVNRLGGGLVMKEELAGHALRNFGDRMKGALLARRQNKPPEQRTPAQRTPAARPPTRTGGPHGTGDPDDLREDVDDIPF